MNTTLIHTIRRDATDVSTSDDLGVLTIYRQPIFSVGTRDLICADFRTPDGQYSQVCKPLRGQGLYVRGSHGDNSKCGSYHDTIEMAVDDALSGQPIGHSPQPTTIHGLGVTDLAPRPPASSCSPDPNEDD